ncbi:tyrosine-protein phosphatase [Novosphingobium lentum]|uniref:tyrosine-protein phosphatase n=1 Tax=Novosphingobium lentum TaxID=145287 RepID=UPI000A52FE08|nr:tyrosine-protein phosphatase [Novosphingobium lentum]
MNEHASGMDRADRVAPGPDRTITLEGIHNLRDYGGYEARAGTLKRGLLWRSGQHAEATPADLDVIHDLDLRTIIDLRGDTERGQYPCLRHSQFDAIVLFEPGETASGHGRAVHEEFADRVRDEASAHQAMATLYRELPWRPALVGTYRLYFDALAHRDGASLLHCFAGKDRTGLAAALVHRILGVHADDVMDDYLLTNTAGNSEARIAAGAEHLRGSGKTMDDAAFRKLMSVHEDFLDNAFDAIIQRHGTIEAYARDVLGVTPAVTAAMEARLVD